MTYIDFMQIKHLINDTDEDGYMGILEQNNTTITYELNDDLFLLMIQKYIKNMPSVYIDCSCITDKNGNITWMHLTLDLKLLKRMLHIYKDSKTTLMIKVIFEIARRIEKGE